MQSQANAVRDIFDTLVRTGDYTLGVFYWEPAWVPVGIVDYNNADAESVLAENRKKWEEFGSGWASSYAGSYDKDDAGKWYGGSSWDNQAMFDFEGKALDSLYVFKYLKSQFCKPGRGMKLHYLPKVTKIKKKRKRKTKGRCVYE